MTFSSTLVRIFLADLSSKSDSLNCLFVFVVVSKSDVSLNSHTASTLMDVSVISTIDKDSDMACVECLSALAQHFSIFLFFFYWSDLFANKRKLLRFLTIASSPKFPFQRLEGLIASKMSLNTINATG